MDTKLYGHVVTATIAIILLVIVIVDRFFLFVSHWMKSIISRRRDKLSKDQKSQNEEDIEMGNTNTEVRQGNVTY